MLTRIHPHRTLPSVRLSSRRGVLGAPVEHSLTAGLHRFSTRADYQNTKSFTIKMVSFLSLGFALPFIACGVGPYRR